MRACGMLLPVSSLPSPYGIGAFSESAYRFVDTLKEAGQKYWQILPLGPTSYGDSPYQSFSTFAGNPYFIDLDQLIKEGLLLQEECDACDFGSDPRYIDYGKLYGSRFTLLKKAYIRSLEKQKAIAAEKLEEQKAAAKDMAAKLENITLKIESKGGDSGKLFGSITSKDIAEALEKQEGMKIDKKKIEMKNPIKQAGETEVTLKLFTEISAQLKVSVTIA